MVPHAERLTPARVLCPVAPARNGEDCFPDDDGVKVRSGRRVPHPTAAVATARGELAPVDLLTILGVRVWGSGFWVSGLRFGVEALGLRVESLELGVGGEG